MPAAAAGAVTATELQQSIFNAPPTASTATHTTSTAPKLVKPPPGTDHVMEDAKSPTSVAGQKRRRDEEEEDESEEDVAMEEDSDDD